MSLVSEDWQWPARWIQARSAWGLVVDGDTIRVSRGSGSGKAESLQESLETFVRGSSLQKRLQQDQAKGIPLVVGIEPHRLILRELTSPIEDPRKADEIWLTLFDAAVPFPLEACRVSLLAREPGDEGLRCLVVGVRFQDLETLKSEWADRGIEPDLAVPEPLVTSPDRKNRLWCGTHRTVWSLWSQRAFVVAGGVDCTDGQDKSLNRQLAAQELDASQVDRVGPGTESETDWLERKLAGAALKSEPLGVNLLGPDLASAGLQKRWGKRERQGRLLAAAVLLLLLVLPLLPAKLIQQKRMEIATKLGPAFERIAGYPAPAGPPGHELSLARQVLAQEWAPLEDALHRIQKPGPTSWLAVGLEKARDLNLQVVRIQSSSSSLSIQVKGQESDAKRFAAFWEEQGWEMEGLRPDGEDWLLKGGRK